MEKSEQGLALVFHEPTLMPWASVFDNVYLPLRLAGVARALAGPQVRAALVDVGLSKLEKSYPRDLSGEMKMRVSVARALVTKPRILLVDEPFAALDEMTRAQMNKDVARLASANGLTVVFVTHSVFESAYLSTRVVVLGALFALSRMVEMSLFPFAVILQVTPVVAKAPLILIYVDSTFAALLTCAWIVAVFRILSGTVMGLRLADHNLRDLFTLYRATPWQRLRYLLAPSALPYFMSSLKVAGGLA